jgi:hypothetical protein
MFMSEMPKEGATMVPRKAGDYFVDFSQFVSSNHTGESLVTAGITLHGMEISSPF